MTHTKTKNKKKLKVADGLSYRIIVFLDEATRNRLEELHARGYSISGLSRTFVKEGLANMPEAKQKL